MEATPIVKEVTINAPAARVWKAITDKDQMKEWYFDIADFKPEPGFEFEFTGGTKEQSFLHKCEVKEAIPNKKLVHSWRYEGYEGMSYVTWELFEEGENRTRVKLTHTGLETFPASNPNFKRENFETGWTAIVGTNIKNYLEMAWL